MTIDSVPRKKRKTGSSNSSATKIKASFDSLPAELIDIILSYCDRPDLVSLTQTSSLLYKHATPLIYCNFNPYEWIDVVQLDQSLRSGMGPKRAMSALIAKSIKSIEFRFHLSPSYEDFPDRDRRLIRAHDRAVEMMMGSLVCILEQTKNLRSFSTQSYLYFHDAKRLCQALAKCPLREISLGEFNCSDRFYSVFESMAIYRVRNLTKLHINANSMETNADYGFSIHLSNLVELLQHNPDIEDFKLESRLGNEMYWTISALKSLEKMKKLHSLDLQNLYLQDGSDRELLRLLSTFGKLNRLRLLFRYGDDPLIRIMGEAVENIPFLSLKDVEISCEEFLKAVLINSKPEVVRIPLCRRTQGIVTNSPGSMASVLIKSESIKEIHLSFDHHTEDEMLAMVQSIPTSVERVAIYSSIPIGISCLEHLNLLTKLKRIILPWCNIVNPKCDVLIEEGASSTIDQEATFIACEILAPKLEYVFFQKKRNNLSGDVSYGSFCERDDPGGRFAVKVERYLPDMTPRSDRFALQRYDSYGGPTSSFRSSEDFQVRAEVVGAHCLCSSCSVEHSRSDFEIPERCMYHHRQDHWSYGRTAEEKLNLLSL